jgi:hypothetical protein
MKPQIRRAGSVHDSSKRLGKGAALFEYLSREDAVSIIASGFVIYDVSVLVVAAVAISWVTFGRAGLVSAR